MPRPCKLTFDLLTLKVVSESRVTWDTPVPILVFLGLSVLDLGRCTRQMSDRQMSDAHHRLMPPPYGVGHNKLQTSSCVACECLYRSALQCVGCICVSVTIHGLRESTSYMLTVFADSDIGVSHNSTGVSIVVTTRPSVPGQNTTAHRVSAYVIRSNIIRLFTTKVINTRKS